MNLILFQVEECARPLPVDDMRAKHVLTVLRRGVGDAFDCGVANGARGRAQITAIDQAGVHLAFSWSETPPPLAPITLLVGMPRPQTVRKIVGEATTLGVERMVFFRSGRSEPSYGDSSLWSSGELERLLIGAAGQAFCTRLPSISRSDSLDDAIEAAAPAVTRIALDNYEAPTALADVPPRGAPVVLAVGSERGWTPRERDVLRAAGYALAHLGGRVLRTETACTAGLAVLKTLLRLW